MDSKIVYKSSVHKTNPLYLVIASIFIYFMLYQYHGFQVFGSDTIETVPYAMWLNDSSIFANDFHQSHLRATDINERITSVYLLHFFGNNIEWGSRILHFFFTVFLCGGMIRFADLFIKHFTLSVVAVFITLFALYNINIGGNELYYNMFVPSLAAKSIAIWALVQAYAKRYLLAGLMLGAASIFQPLVGLQLFVVVLPIVLIISGFSKDSLKFVTTYTITGGLFVLVILWAQGPNVESTASFYDIVKFRIAHHFFPAYFPKSHILILGGLYILAVISYARKNKFLGLFFGVAIAGIIVYTLGVSLKIDTILSSQFMKINIWLKFFAVISITAFIKSQLESRHHMYLGVALFSISLIIALTRFNPVYDADYPSDLYTWISINTSVDDIMLVPPELNDFKGRTARSTYFDFKAMLHHKPAIFEWYKRFQEVYGMKAQDRTKEIEIFGEINRNYLNGEAWKSADIDYIITRENQKISNRELVFEASNYKVYK